jgi:hypothetical protein
MSDYDIAITLVARLLWQQFGNDLGNASPIRYQRSTDWHATQPTTRQAIYATFLCVTNVGPMADAEDLYPAWA